MNIKIDGISYDIVWDCALPPFHVSVYVLRHEDGGFECAISEGFPDEVLLIQDNGEGYPSEVVFEAFLAIMRHLYRSDLPLDSFGYLPQYVLGQADRAKYFGR